MGQFRPAKSQHTWLISNKDTWSLTVVPGSSAQIIVDITAFNFLWYAYCSLRHNKAGSERSSKLNLSRCSLARPTVACLKITSEMCAGEDAERSRASCPALLYRASVPGNGAVAFSATEMGRGQIRASRLVPWRWRCPACPRAFLRRFHQGTTVHRLAAIIQHSRRLMRISPGRHAPFLGAGFASRVRCWKLRWPAQHSRRFVLGDRKRNSKFHIAPDELRCPKIFQKEIENYRTYNDVRAFPRSRPYRWIFFRLFQIYRDQILFMTNFSGLLFHGFQQVCC